MDNILSVWQRGLKKLMIVAKRTIDRGDGIWLCSVVFYHLLDVQFVRIGETHQLNTIKTLFRYFNRHVHSKQFRYILSLTALHIHLVSFFVFSDNKGVLVLKTKGADTSGLCKYVRDKKITYTN